MELRHLKYFVAVVERHGFREASRYLHVAQPAISQTLSNLESEMGVKLFARSGRSVKLTPEGEIFYAETLRTLEQADHAVEAAQRASRGEVGTISVGFCGAATYSFLPTLVQRYREQFPGVKLVLQEMTPFQQENAFAQRTIDVGFTRELSTGLAGSLHSRLLYREPLLAALPASREVKGKRVRVEDLARERFVLFHRRGSPVLYDSIIGLCNERGFSPTVDSEPDMLQKATSLVAAHQGISIVPACALNLRYDGVRLYRLLPDDVRAALFLAWPKSSKSTILRSFLDLVESQKELILQATRVV